MRFGALVACALLAACGSAPRSEPEAEDALPAEEALVLPAYPLEADLVALPLAGPQGEFRFFVDGKQQADVDLLAERPEEYKVTALCAAGVRRIGIRFLNDFYVASPREDRNLYIHAVIIRKAK